jgi:hypothetical protein
MSSGFYIFGINTLFRVLDFMIDEKIKKKLM